MVETYVQPLNLQGHRSSNLQGHHASADFSGSRSRPNLAAVPDYLMKNYWWAYVHPRAVKFWDRLWLINLILWGNYNRLRDAALAQWGDALPGATLQVACAYGNLSSRLARNVAAGGGTLDIVDVLPVQLQNMRSKLPAGAPVRLLAMNSTQLQLPDCSYDRVLLFFLLHEQPANVRPQTLREAFRVVKPGGKVMIVDYAKPRWWQPLRYTWPLFLAALEPFALGMWRESIAKWVPAAWGSQIDSQRFFGGLYQVTTFTRRQPS